MPPAPPNPPAEPSTLTVALRPWWGLARPRAAAAAFTHASSFSIFVSLLGAGVVAGLMLSGIFFWEEVYDLDYVLGNDDRWHLVTREHSITEIWGRCLEADLTPLAIPVAGTVVWLSIAVAGGAILHLQRVHETGSIRRSLQMSLRGAASCSVLIGLLAVAAVWAAVYADRLRMPTVVEQQPTYWPWPWHATLLSHVPWLAFAFGIIWVGWAIRGTRPHDPTCDRPPLCEGCGYDLRHRPTGGRCTECGLDVARSLNPQRARRGCSWENRPTPWSWLNTSFAVLFTPGRFYRDLRMRTRDDASTVFSVAHYVLLAAAVGVVTHSLMQPPYFEVYPVYVYGETDFLVLALRSLVILTLIGWLLHRVGGLIVWWVLCYKVPNGRWIAKIQDYEVVFLWVLLTGTFIWKIVLGHILALLAERQRLFLLSPIAVLLLEYANIIPILLLMFVWLWRYRRAYLATRWNNF